LTKSVFLVKRTWGSDEKPPPGSKTSIETIEPKSTVAIALAPPPPPPLNKKKKKIYSYFFKNFSIFKNSIFTTTLIFFYASIPRS